MKRLQDNALKLLLRQLLDLIAPRLCASCGRKLGVNEQLLCCSCNLHLPRPLFSKNAKENEMAKLFYGKFPLERAAALYIFTPHNQSANIIYKLKYKHRRDIGFALGEMMAEEFMGDGFFRGVDVIVPVPLTWKRKRERGYNQSLEIARGIAQVTGICIESHAIKRTHFNLSQTQMSHEERMKNVENAFALDKRAGLLEHKHVLLVDDVVTTGSTISAVGRELMKLEGVRISVMTAGYAGIILNEISEEELKTYYQQPQKQ